MIARRTATAWVVTLGLALAGCSGNECRAVCGNRIVEYCAEECDDGNTNPNDGCSNDCRSQRVVLQQLEVYWTINKRTEEPRFAGDDCSQVGAEKARISLRGPVERSAEPACAAMPWRLIHDPNGEAFPPGTYELRLALAAAGGELLTTEKVRSIEVRAGQREIRELNFEIADFVGPHAGVLAIVPRWGASPATCASAGLDQQRFVLTDATGRAVDEPILDGQSVAVGRTGGPAWPCTDAGLSTPFEIGVARTPEGGRDYVLPWGIYDLVVEGLAGGRTTHCARLRLFCGAGVNGVVEARAQPPGDAGTCGE